MRTHAKTGFTLAELLISLAILGVIATWTIPKILFSQQNQQYKAAAREVNGMITSAAQIVRVKNGDGQGMILDDLTPYMNYVSVESTANIDSVQSLGTIACSDPAWGCIKLHSGAILAYDKGSTYLLHNWVFDPDGKVTDGTTNGPGKSVAWIVGANERAFEFGDFGDMLGDPSLRQYTPPWYLNNP